MCVHVVTQILSTYVHVVVGTPVSLYTTYLCLQIEAHLDRDWTWNIDSFSTTGFMLFFIFYSHEYMYMCAILLHFHFEEQID